MNEQPIRPPVNNGSPRPPRPQQRPPRRPGSQQQQANRPVGQKKASQSLPQGAKPKGELDDGKTRILPVLKSAKDSFMEKLKTQTTRWRSNFDTPQDQPQQKPRPKDQPTTRLMPRDERQGLKRKPPQARPQLDDRTRRLSQAGVKAAKEQDSQLKDWERDRANGARVYQLLGYTTAARVDRKYQLEKRQRGLRRVLTFVLALVILLILFSLYNPIKNWDEFKRVLGIESIMNETEITEPVETAEPLESAETTETSQIE